MRFVGPATTSIEDEEVAALLNLDIDIDAKRRVGEERSNRADGKLVPMERNFPLALL